MTSAFIRTRTTSTGEKRHVIVYRRGGRAYRQESAGTFKTMRDAKLRRDLVAGWLAQGLDPKVELAKLAAPEVPRSTLTDAFNQWRRSRHDATDRQKHQWDYALAAYQEFLGADRDPRTITVADCRLLIAHLLDKGYTASTVRTYYGPLQQVLDFLEVEPNPARHKTVKLPSLVREEPQVMTRAQFHAWLERAPAKYRLFFRVLEATGMRVGELWQLQWGDVNAVDNQFRVSVARSKSRVGRWVPVPAALMEQVQDTVPLDDRRPDGRVFRELPSATAAKNAMARACMLAGVPHFHPHDLRHRRASLWHHQGIPDRVIQEWGGWKSRKVLNDVYSHVVLEPRDDDWFGEAHRRLGLVQPAREGDRA